MYSFWWTSKYIWIFYHFWTLGWHRRLQTFLVEEKDSITCTMHGQYHGCLWPGDARSYGISSPGINPVFSGYSGFTTRGLNSLWPGDGTWCQRSGWALNQVLACCLVASSHYQTHITTCYLTSLTRARGCHLSMMIWACFEGNKTITAHGQDVIMSQQLILPILSFRKCLLQ